MYELIQVGEKTYYISCPAKMGIYKISEKEVCLIDSGNNKDTGKKVLKILDENGWALKMIINTHSHVDHIGGNNFLQQRTGCSIYTVGIEVAFTRFPNLGPSFIYGAYPCKEIRNKFLYAEPSKAEELTEAILPEGLQMLRLDGHSFSMLGLKTDDGIWFLADSLSSKEIIEKYHILFLYDVSAYIASLQIVNDLKGKLFIPSHAEPVEDIAPLVKINLEKVDEILHAIVSICAQPISFDEILKAIFDRYALTMDFNQHVLVGSTIRSYLSYLYDSKKMQIAFVDNTLLWQAIRES